eukprot:COSAG01_NODE_215_length_21709_cov_141.101217_35_plen_166_part_00
MEKDSCHSPADFGKEKKRAPEDLKHWFDGVEFLDYEQREYKAKAMLEEIMKQGGPPAAAARSELEPEPEAIEEGMPPAAAGIAVTTPMCHTNVLQWLESVKLNACHPALDEQGYGDDIDMVVDGDEEEVGVMLAAVAGMEGVKLPIVKKFKCELAKLRGRGEKFR